MIESMIIDVTRTSSIRLSSNAANATTKVVDNCGIVAAPITRLSLFEKPIIKPLNHPLMNLDMVNPKIIESVIIVYFCSEKSNGRSVFIPIIKKKIGIKIP